MRKHKDPRLLDMTLRRKRKPTLYYFDRTFPNRFHGVAVPLDYNRDLIQTKADVIRLIKAHGKPGKYWIQYNPGGYRKKMHCVFKCELLDNGGIIIRLDKLEKIGIYN